MLWTFHIIGGPRRVNHAAVAVGDKIYSFGGFVEEEDYSESRPLDIYVFLTDQNKWIPLGVPSKDDPQYKCVPYQRYGHTVVSYGKYIYLWGGRNDEKACDTIFCFDTDKLVWTTPETFGQVPYARDGHSACVIGDFMYVFGGFIEIFEEFTQNLHKLNLKTMEWSIVKPEGPPPSYRDFHTACSIEGNMYLFGGRSDDQGPHHTGKEVYDNNVYCFDTVENVWKCFLTTGQQPCGRRSHSAFPYNGKMYVFGGFNGILRRHFNDLYEFDPASQHWALVECSGHFPTLRRRHSFCLVGSRAYVFCGTSPWTGWDEFPEDLRQHDIDPSDLESTLVSLDDLHILDFEPSLKTLATLVVLRSNLDTTALPHLLRHELEPLSIGSNVIRDKTNG